jgi:high-affinity Fe2+/Pb2+ permease
MTTVSFEDFFRRSFFKEASAKDDTANYGLTIGGRYLSSPATLTNGQFTGLTFTTDQKLRVDATIVTGDIEIGAVEIKNATTDDRVIVKAGSSFAVGDMAMGIADANVLSALKNDSKAYDSTNITYVSGGASDGEISTVVYKLAAATVYTLTMAYDATTGKLTTVTRS